MKSIIDEKSIRMQSLREWLANTSIKICAEPFTSSTVDVMSDLINHSFGSAYTRIENLLSNAATSPASIYSINHITSTVIKNFTSDSANDIAMLLGYLSIMYEKKLIHYLSRRTCQVLIHSIFKHLTDIMKYQGQHAHIKKRRCIYILTQAMFYDRYRIAEIISHLQKYENNTRTLCNAYLDAAGTNKSLESRFILRQQSIFTYKKININQAQQRTSPPLELIDENDPLKPDNRVGQF